MQFRPNIVVGFAIVVILNWPSIGGSIGWADHHDRETPLVRAVAQCRASVVNLRGRKSVRGDEAPSLHDNKQVNGMGTGVIIDPRGYILTNYHVVQDVNQIQVTTSERERTVAQLIAHDPETDLALLKIELSDPLPAIPIGTSSDLMLAETVAAVGNAYGYEHTVTVGIISQLNRTVQVNDDQIYRNLIQTDAPINPGNSGGPLLNLDGKMIGINVAVRIGAQGIAFAIPANDAMEVASRLMQQHVLQNRGLQHGLEVETLFENHTPQLVVKNVLPNSPAQLAGIQKGAQIIKINGQLVARSLDLHSALISTDSNELTLAINQQGELQQVSFELTKMDNHSLEDESWRLLGLRLRVATAAEMQNRHPNYQRGLKVTQVRASGPADAEGIMPGDILVAMHGWKTESLENLHYILNQPEVRNHSNFMFYILRENEPFYGKMRIASQAR